MKKIVLSLAFALFLSPVYAQENDYVEGASYERLNQFQPVQTGDKIEVVEMFWYRCPHCYRLEPFMQRWLENKPDNAEYVPIPAILNENWEFHGRAYYTFEALGKVDEAHVPFFNAIHRDRTPFNTVEQIAEWAAQFDMDPQTVVSTFNSFAVNNKISFASLMGRNYQVTGVPTIIVDGKYKTSVSMAGSHEELLNVINFLVEKAAAERES